MLMTGYDLFAGVPISYLLIMFSIVKAVVGAFNQEKALVGAFSVITNLRMELFQALIRMLEKLF